MKEHMAFVCVGMAFANQDFDHVDDFSNMMRRLGYNIWRADAEGLDVFLIGEGIALGQGGDVLAIFCCGCIDLVVDIRDVADVSNLRVPRAQQPG